MLAGLGVLNPVTGALVHNAGSVLVIVNSALLLSWKGQAFRSVRLPSSPIPPVGMYSALLPAIADAA